MLSHWSIGLGAMECEWPNFMFTKPASPVENISVFQDRAVSEMRCLPVSLNQGPNF